MVPIVPLLLPPSELSEASVSDTTRPPRVYQHFGRFQLAMELHISVVNVGHSLLNDIYLYTMSYM